MTIPHEELKQRLAVAIADSAELCAYVKENFGRMPLVVVNRYGAEGAPGEAQAPFIWIFSEEAENEAGDVDEETFGVGVVFGAVDSGPCVRKYIRRLRSADSAGIEVYGMLDKVEAVREMIFAIVRESTHGAIFRTATRTESNYLEHPLEWAKLALTYAEPETL